MKKSLLLLMCFGLVGCAATGQYVAMPDQNVHIQDLTKARIYVVRPAGYYGSAISMVVKDGNREIGNTKGGGRYLCWERDPGMMHLTSTSENTFRLNVTVEAGKRYYILQSVKMGLMIVRNKLTLLDDVKGEKYLRKCKPASGGVSTYVQALKEDDLDEDVGYLLDAAKLMKAGQYDEAIEKINKYEEAATDNKFAKEWAEEYRNQIEEERQKQEGVQQQAKKKSTGGLAALLSGDTEGVDIQTSFFHDDKGFVMSDQTSEGGERSIGMALMPEAEIQYEDGHLQYSGDVYGEILLGGGDNDNFIRVWSGMSKDKIETLAREKGIAINKRSSDEWEIAGNVLLFRDGNFQALKSK